jgi:uncharacterized membrane protein YjfL (UPF0719 family)
MLNIYFIFWAIWGLCVIVLLLLTINTLERIISKPLVQQSKESNIAVWLSLPVVCCFTVGSFLGFANRSAFSIIDSIDLPANIDWIGPLYLAAGSKSNYSLLCAEKGGYTNPQRFLPF